MHETDAATASAPSPALSRHNRWQAYFCYNMMENCPESVPEPRPDHVPSGNWDPVAMAMDETILAGAPG
ncbi:MAG: hypothetical protein QF926_09800 [Alphaproteobacteria bacterium]|nr:hypothetical protein [Alphaproteobacteria bacterium]MDP6516898.1 hypothetical protein [Alphaproteobacteria bacterium]